MERFRMKVYPMVFMIAALIASQLIKYWATISVLPSMATQQMKESSNTFIAVYDGYLSSANNIEYIIFVICVAWFIKINFFKKEQ